MSYIGKKGALRLDPEGQCGFAQAEQMQKEGYDPTVIKVQTGWEKGIDAKWRFEIPDPFLDSEAIEAYVKPRFGEPIDIGFLLKTPQLLVAYPEFKELKLYAIYSPRRGMAGYYSPDTNGMVISMGTPSDNFDLQIEGVLLHEIQHLIQEIEGFARGGSPKDLGRRKYMRMAGEVEARNICLRHFLTNEQRLQSLRTDTQDIPDRQQIVRF